MIALIVVGVVIVIEVILATTWNRFYFTVGVPLFVLRVQRLATLESVSFDDLQKSTATAAGTPLVFRRLDPELIAFREKGLGGIFHYTPLMRGVVRRTPGEPYVAIVGLVNWFVVVGTIALVVTLRRNIVDVLPMYLLAFAVLYLIQAVRFARMAKALREPAIEPAVLAPSGGDQA